MLPAASEESREFGSMFCRDALRLCSCHHGMCTRTTMGRDLKKLKPLFLFWNMTQRVTLEIFLWTKIQPKSAFGQFGLQFYSFFVWRCLKLRQSAWISCPKHWIRAWNLSWLASKDGEGSGEWLDFGCFFKGILSFLFFFFGEGIFFLFSLGKNGKKVRPIFYGHLWKVQGFREVFFREVQRIWSRIFAFKNSMIFQIMSWKPSQRGSKYEKNGRCRDGHCSLWSYPGSTCTSLSNQLGRFVSWS